MTKSIHLFAMFSLLAVVALVLPDMAFASTNAGSGLFSDIQSAITGNLGTVIGLGISLFGLWMWLMQQNSWGLAVLIFGAAITAFPGLYSGMATGFRNAFSESGAGGTLQVGPGR